MIGRERACDWIYAGTGCRSITPTDRHGVRIQGTHIAKGTTDSRRAVFVDDRSVVTHNHRGHVAHRHRGCSRDGTRIIIGDRNTNRIHIGSCCRESIVQVLMIRRECASNWIYASTGRRSITPTDRHGVRIQGTTSLNDPLIVAVPSSLITGAL